MDDSKKTLTPFEQEFNRLSFLASIATGSTPPEQPAANITTQPDPGGTLRDILGFIWTASQIWVETKRKLWSDLKSCVRFASLFCKSKEHLWNKEIVSYFTSEALFVFEIIKF